MKHPIGAFIGAIVYVLLQNFAIDLFVRERFNLVIGGVFLAIVLFSPDGLLGLWAKLRSAWRGPSLPTRRGDNRESNEEKNLDALDHRRRGGDLPARGLAPGAQETLKIGLLANLEGPFAVPGQDGYPRRRHGAEGKERHGRRQEDRVRQGLVRRDARQGRRDDAQGGRAGQGPDHDRAALGRRGHRGQELRQDQARHHLHQRLVGRAGDDAARPGAELLPLQHRRRAVDGRPRRARALQGLQEGLPRRRGLRLPVLAGPGLHGELLRQGRQGRRQGVGSARHQGLRGGRLEDPEGHRRACSSCSAAPMR